jgi:hypothetical protein
MRLALASDVALLAIRPVQRRKITCDAGVYLLYPLTNLSHRVVLVSVVDGLELAAVDRDHSPGEQVKPAAQRHELTANRSDRLAIVLTKVGDGFEIWREPTREPHQFDVALRLALQTPARLDAIEITVEIKLQHGRWMIGRSACCLGLHPRETKPGQIEFCDENIDHTNGVVLAYVIFQSAGQKRVLRPILRLHESTHSNVPRDDHAARIPGRRDDTRPRKKIPCFYTAWVEIGQTAQLARTAVFPGLLAPELPFRSRGIQ